MKFVLCISIRMDIFLWKGFPNLLRIAKLLSNLHLPAVLGSRPRRAQPDFVFTSCVFQPFSEARSADAPRETSMGVF